MRRREIAARYLAGWSSNRVRPLGAGVSGEPCWHLFPTRVAAERKAALAGWLRGHGILTGEHYPVLIPDQPAMAGVTSACFGALERARGIAEEELSLPIHPYMENSEVDTVLEVLGRWEG